MKNIFLFIEPLNICNISCPFCQWDVFRKDMIHRKMTFFEFSNLFSNIIKFHKKKYNVTTIFLWFRGEPFLHIDIYKMIELVKTKNIKTIISTNGTHLKGNSEKIIDSGLDHLIISCEGITKEVYELHRKGANFDDWVVGVKELCQKKKERKAKLGVELQFMYTKRNLDYVKRVKGFANFLGVDRVYFKTLNFSFAGKNKERVFKDINDWLPNRQRFVRYPKIKRLKVIQEKAVQQNDVISKIEKVLEPSSPRMHCQWRNGIIITVEGDLILCCEDVICSTIFGNAFREDFGILYDKWLQLNSLVAQRKLEICKHCFKFDILYGIKFALISLLEKMRRAIRI